MTQALLFWALAVIGLAIVVRHHAGYLARRRSTTFGAFLETAGWIVVTLVAVGAAAGGLTSPGTRIVEIAAAMTGVLAILAGRQFRG